MAKIANLAIPLGWRYEPEPLRASTGISELDTALGGGLPQGRITEFLGPASAGSATLMQSILAAATARGEHCALIDGRDTFDPPSAAAHGAILQKLIWIRCHGNAEHAMRAADLILQSGGFGAVVLDLSHIPPALLARIPPTSWFRFRRAVEATPTAFVVVGNRSLAKSCAALLVETRRVRGKFLHGIDYQITVRKPPGKEPLALHVRLHLLPAC